MQNLRIRLGSLNIISCGVCNGGGEVVTGGDGGLVVVVIAVVRVPILIVIDSALP